ncbi:DUF397 domain-containing protein [Streptomyces sp. NPDC013181]
MAVAETPAWVGVRDTKDPEGPAITVRPRAFAAAVAALRAGRL